MDNNKDSSSVKGEVISASVGAVAGAGGAVTAVATAGTVAGLGATGITSGLAAVGTVVGGSMAAGLAVVASAPIAAAGVGYGVYRLVKWLRNRRQEVES